MIDRFASPVDVVENFYYLFHNWSFFIVIFFTKYFLLFVVLLQTIIVAKSWLWEFSHKTSCSSFKSVFARRLAAERRLHNWVLICKEKDFPLNLKYTNVIVALSLFWNLLPFHLDKNHYWCHPSSVFGTKRLWNFTFFTCQFCFIYLFMLPLLWWHFHMP